MWLKFCFLVLLFNALIYRWLLGLIYFWRCFLCIFFIIVGRWVLICVNLYQSIFLTEALPFFILPMYQYYYSIPMYSIILKFNYLHTVYRYVSDIFIFLYFSSFFIYYHRRLNVNHLSPCYCFLSFLQIIQLCTLCIYDFRLVHLTKYVTIYVYFQPIPPCLMLS